MKNKLLILLLGLLGFGCSDNSNGFPDDIPVEYGTPHSDFRFIGRVTHATQQPVPQILVEVGNQSGHTDADGNYDLRIQGDMIPPTEIRFFDTDGLENGGDFAPQTLSIDPRQAEQTGPGDGKWYDGEFTFTIDAELAPKSNDNE